MNGVNKTLYIPLYGKACVSRRGILLQDAMAETIWEKEGFVLKGKARSRWLAYSMAMRAKVFDRWLEEKMEAYPDAVVLHPGCGMDSRITRVGARGHKWFDVDFPEVIAERKKYFSEKESYAMISGDLRDKTWLEKLPGGTAIVVLEGVSMYLTGEECRQFLQELAAHFERVFLLMDVYTVFGARASKYKNPIRTVGVTRVYGVDDPEELTRGTAWRVCGELDMSPEDLIAELPKREQGIFRTVYGGKLAKKIYRLYAFEV